MIDVSGENSKILCRTTALNIKNDKPVILLLKRKNMFEIIIKLIKKDKKNEIIREFEVGNPIIEFLVDYYKASCVRENKYPENYPYIPLYSSDVIIKKLKESPTELGVIKYQIKNSFNKINMLLTNKGILIPILETGIIENTIENGGFHVFSYSNLIEQQLNANKPDTLRTLNDYIKSIQKLNKILGTPHIQILGVMNSPDARIGGLLTNFGYPIPYKKVQGEETLGIKQLEFKYYLDIDNQLDKENEDNTPLELYIKNDNELHAKLFTIKKIVGEELSLLKNQPFKKQIEDIIVDTTHEKGFKVKEIANIISKLRGLKQEDIEDITLFKVIANEILNDNKEKLILNNIITSDKFNRRDIIVRDVESVLLNINDIRQWVNKHQQLV
jgi:hypothetical protein